MSDFIHFAKGFIKDRFYLKKVKEDEAAIVDSIRKGIEFRDTNIWVLVFAIFLASIGLNINSTAVVIGAMLVSPLMGPIMGIGLGLGIFDFTMVKSAAKNMVLMVVISIGTSTLYFLLSPLNIAQSELLARTTPTIWDVLIAMFGGLAGIVAGVSKEKGNVIPGVAIATALMPPLCTAGFGLARGNFYFFGGAFYLFCINMVFISVSTFFVVRLLKFPIVTFVNATTEKKIRQIISVIIFITVVPSIFIAYFTVKKAVFEERAKSFLKNEFNFPKTQVIKQEYSYENNTISLLMIGDELTPDVIKNIEGKEVQYNLKGVKLNINQGQNGLNKADIETLKTGILEKMYHKDDSVIGNKDKLIQSLENQINMYHEKQLPITAISKEILAINSNISEFSIHNDVYYNTANNSYDTIMTAYTKFKKRPDKAEKEQIIKWLKARTGADTLKLILE